MEQQKIRENQKIIRTWISKALQRDNANHNKLKNNEKEMRKNVQTYNQMNIMIADINAILSNTGIFMTLASLAIYVILGYLSCAFIKKDFRFANGIPRMIVFSLLLGWAAIPIALVLLIFRTVAKIIIWLFEIY